MYLLMKLKIQKYDTGTIDCKQLKTDLELIMNRYTVRCVSECIYKSFHWCASALAWMYYHRIIDSVNPQRIIPNSVIKYL